MKSKPIPQATAVIRRSGKWSVVLGPAGIFQRLLARERAILDSDRRLGMLVTCVGAIALTALECVGVAVREVSVTVQNALGTNPEAAQSLLIVITLDCDEGQAAVQKSCESYLRESPLLSLQGLDAARIDIRVHAHATAPILMSY